MNQKGPFKEVVPQVRYLNAQYGVTSNLDVRMELHRRFKTNPTSFADWAWEKYRFADHQTVLDVGCGTGGFWANGIFRQRNDFSISMVDASKAMVDECKKKYSGDDQFTFTCSPAESLPFDDGTFDRIVCHFMLYHADSKTAVCKQLKRLAKKGSALIGIVTNSERHLSDLFNLAIEIKSDFPISDTRGHQAFCEENADMLLSDHFSDYTKEVYEDVLMITDAVAATNYIRSSVPDLKESFDEPFFAEYEHRVMQKIQKNGCFKVQKRSAMYLVNC